MYALELLCEFHLPQDQIKQNQEHFMTLFKHSLGDSDVRVKVSTLKALTNFLTRFDDEDDVMKYKSMMEPLINLVIEVLKTSEDEGKASLQSLIELSQSYPEIWQDTIKTLVFVCSDVMKATTFDESTRQTALEIISTISEQAPKMLRNQSDCLKEHFFPAIFMMLVEVEDNIADWAAQDEEEIHGKDDISSIAAEALDRLSDILGEKTMLACSTQII